MNGSVYNEPRILLAGDSAVVVEFGNGLDELVNRKVHLLANVVTSAQIEGVLEVVPTYRSLLVYYNPLRIPYENLLSFLLRLSRDLSVSETRESRKVIIPTVYGGEFGPDLSFVAQHNGLSEEEVIKIHSSAEYLVYMLGFTPGFAYLGGLSPIIASPRLSTPRTSIPAGSIGIGGSQTGVYPLSSPGGWRIIGRTPLALFDPYRPSPALLEPGDRVRFQPINTEELSLYVRTREPEHD